MPSKPLSGAPVVIGTSVAVMAMRSVPCACAPAEAAPKAKPTVRASGISRDRKASRAVFKTMSSRLAAFPEPSLVAFGSLCGDGRMHARPHTNRVPGRVSQGTCTMRTLKRICRPRKGAHPFRAAASLRGRARLAWPSASPARDPPGASSGRGPGAAMRLAGGPRLLDGAGEEPDAALDPPHIQAHSP